MTVAGDSDDQLQVSNQSSSASENEDVTKGAPQGGSGAMCYMQNSLACYVICKFLFTLLCEFMCYVNLARKCYALKMQIGGSYMQK